MTNSEKNIKKTNSRRSGLRKLQGALSKLTDKAIRKRGFVEAALIHQWSTIVGSDIAKWSSPDRLVFRRGSRLDATLYLDVLAARALELQHLEPFLLERINVVFGYKAITKIAIRQISSLGDTEKVVPDQRNLDEKEKNWISNQLKNTTNPNLKEALEALGEAILIHN
jgi:hypothetical protein